MKSILLSVCVKIILSNSRCAISTNLQWCQILQIFTLCFSNLVFSTFILSFNFQCLKNLLFSTYDLLSFSIGGKLSYYVIFKVCIILIYTYEMSVCLFVRPPPFLFLNFWNLGGFFLDFLWFFAFFVIFGFLGIILGFSGF